MHTSGGLRSDEASEAAWEGGRGAVSGAAKVLLLVRLEISLADDDSGV